MKGIVYKYNPKRELMKGLLLKEFFEIKKKLEVFRSDFLIDDLCHYLVKRENEIFKMLQEGNYRVDIKIKKCSRCGRKYGYRLDYLGENRVFYVDDKNVIEEESGIQIGEQNVRFSCKCGNVIIWNFNKGRIK